MSRAEPSNFTGPLEVRVRATICKWGNSLGIRVPRGLAEEAGLAEGSLVDLRVENGRIVAEPVTIEDLDSLLAKMGSESKIILRTRVRSKDDFRL